MSELARQRIREAKETEAIRLDLSGCGIASWTEISGLFKLKKLQWLNLSAFLVKDDGTRELSDGTMNLLDDLPEEFATLIELKSLYLGGSYEKRWPFSGGSLGNLPQSLEHLVVNYCGLQNLTSLSSLTSLASLSLWSNQLVELSPLSALTSLTSLNLGDNQLVELSPLSTLTSLISLHLSTNQVVDVSPLSTLTSLTSLHLSNNQVVDVSPLSSLTSLTSLHLINNQVVDVSPLLTLTSLTSLHLGHNQVVDVGPLSTLTSLTSLSLWSNQLVELSPLSTLTSLTSLNLSDNQVVDVSPLSTLTSLTSLDLNDNQVVDVNPLLTLPRLTSLDLSNNQVVDVSPLSTLTNLTSLSLWSNQLVDLSSLSTLTSLTSLDLSDNQVVDVSSLSTLTGLTSLILSYNQVVDVSPLSTLTSLTSLSLWSNQLVELSPLSALTSLTSLNLSYNQLTDFNKLLYVIRLPNLKELFYSGNKVRSLPAYLLVDNCLHDVRNYFKLLDQAEMVFSPELKLILIGNGQVGKSSLVECLVKGKFRFDGDSTHAIQLTRWDFRFKSPLEIKTQRDGLTAVPELPLNIWDLGGQDIYQTTHRIFLNTEAIYLLLWNVEGEASETHSDGQGGEFPNYPLTYWLHYIQSLSRNSEVLLVQTHRDKDRFRSPNYREILGSIFNIHPQFLSTSTWNEDAANNGISELTLALEGVIKKKLEDEAYFLPKSWWNLRDALYLKMTEREAGGEGLKEISYTEFISLCADHGIGHSEGMGKAECDTVLSFLHRSGVVFYDQEHLGDRIILDQEWAIQGIYTLFDRSKSYYKFMKDLKGRFSKERLQEEWRAYNQQEIELFIQFMLGCELLLETKRVEESIYYVAPELLPEVPSEELRAFWQMMAGKDSFYYAYEHEFLHRSVITAFIVRAGFLASEVGLWRYGVWIKDENTQTHVLVESIKDGEGGRMSVRTIGPMARKLSDLVLNELEKLHFSDRIEKKVSLNGVSYIDLEELTKNAKEGILVYLDHGSNEKIQVDHYRKYLSPKHTEKSLSEQKKELETAKEQKPGFADYMAEPSHDQPKQRKLRTVRHTMEEQEVIEYQPGSSTPDISQYRDELAALMDESVQQGVRAILENQDKATLDQTKEILAAISRLNDIQTGGLAYLFERTFSLLEALNEEIAERINVLRRQLQPSDGSIKLKTQIGIPLLCTIEAEYGLVEPLKAFWREFKEFAPDFLKK